MSDAPPAPAEASAAPPESVPFYRMTPIEAALALDVDPEDGLSAAEAARRLEEHGPNRLAEAERRPALLRFFDQFRNALVYILLGAAVLSAAVGDLKDPVVILIVLLINAVLGYIQENKADEAMAALASMLELVVKVRRDAEVVELAASALVPGDVVLLEAGDRVPADGRLLVANNLSIDEATLTGESVPSDKHASHVVPVGGRGTHGVAIGDRDNCGFMNTTVVRGRTDLLVTATGMDTEVGRLAGLLNAADPQETPLQHQLDQLGKRLALIAALAVLAVFALAMAQGETLADAALEAVALAVAAIPEGLPAVVTVTLAIGVSRMAEHNAIVKRLASVETLGSTTAICSDKTGTLTLNQMTATDLVYRGSHYEVEGRGYGAQGSIRRSGEDRGPHQTTDDSAPDDSAPDDSTELASVLRLGLLCNDAHVRAGEGGRPEVVGDPTEGALVVLARKAGLDPDAERSRHGRVAEVPFDSATKFMATLHAHPDDDRSALLVVKGAPDVVLDRCSSVRGAVDVEQLDADARATVLGHNEALGARGLRVLAVASRTLPVRADEFEGELDAEVNGLTLEALVGILDPARPEVIAAIEECRRAGVGVRMITGDHASTAGAIATELGIVGGVVTGAELDAMDDAELAGRIEEIGVCARVSPEHKVRVVKALQANGEVVAMTGDGVNDAPALKQAEIGVAMGITGTEVTKEAGDMVLADDNFATIVAAVERGRAIYENILTFVRFQLTTNIAAISSILVARLAGLPIPFNPIQVLFVNIIADGPPAMSLGVDPPKPGLMDSPPRATDEKILSGDRLGRIVFAAMVMTVLTIGMLVWQRDTESQAVALTMAFTTFVLLQMVNALSVRGGSASVFTRHTLTNRVLWLALGGVVLVQVLVVQLPALQKIFDTVALDAAQWAVCAGAAALFLVVEEIRRVVDRRLSRN